MKLKFTKLRTKTQFNIKKKVKSKLSLVNLVIFKIINTKIYTHKQPQQYTFFLNKTTFVYVNIFFLRHLYIKYYTNDILLLKFIYLLKILALQRL